MTMMRLLSAIVAMLVAAPLGWTEPATYKILPGEHALMELIVEKTGFLSGKKHRFTFSRFARCSVSCLATRPAPVEP